VLVYAADNAGRRDAGDGSVRPNLPTIVVQQTTVAPDLVSGGSALFLRAALVPLGGSSRVDQVNVTRLGTSTDPASVSVYLDEGNGAWDSADRFLGADAFVGGRATLSVDLTITGPSVLWLIAQWASMTPTSTFGMSIAGVRASGFAALEPPDFSLAYLVARPSGVIVDGAFGDWFGRTYGMDVLGDVVSSSRSPSYNANVDLDAVAVDVGANFTGYVRVDGRILGGEDIPTSRLRTSSVGILDSDGDSVPDSVEIILTNPDLRFDFDNNNRTDALEGGDVDGDGLADFPDGPDVWLNTTIPAWYPVPYAGLNVSRYIGPIAPIVQEGVDTVYAYIDADNSSATGLSSKVDGRWYGFEYGFAILGRNGVIRSSEVYAFAPGRAVPWQPLGSIEARLDAHRLEFGMNATALNLSSGYRTVFFASDWRFDHDAALPDSAVATFAVAAQAIATNVVINEVSPRPNPEWVELANPTASPVSLAGWSLVFVRPNGREALVYTFTTEVVGAWGSGAEYLRVILPDGSLPNRGRTLRLRNGGSIIDETAYPANARAAQTWSRFKDPMTGIPVDNDNSADFYLSTAPSPGAPNDRHRPSIVVAKTIPASVATPGDVLTYTVYFNNTNTGLARTVWINDTLPAGVSFLTSSVAPSTVAGATYGWVFTNVLPSSSNSLTISVLVNGNGADLSQQANQVSLDYVDQLNRRLLGSRAWANFTLVRPVIQIAKIANRTNAVAGDSITFTIFYNNTGSAPAGTVTIKDVLPAELTYAGSSPSPTWTDGRNFYWNFTNVAPGDHAITLTAVVAATATGAQLVNWAFLNYTSANGYVLASSSASSTVAIPEFQDFVVVLAVPLVVLLLRHRVRLQRRKEGAVADSVPRIGDR